MKPMKNWQPRDYRTPRPDCPDCSPREHYRDLLNKGIDDGTARAMSGFDAATEAKEARAVLKSWGFWILIAVWLAVAIWSRPTVSAEISSAERNEAWFAACLGGVTIQVGDQLFQCLPAGRAKGGAA